MTTQNSNNVAFLLPLYGKPFIEKFFTFGLKTLLADGNISALKQDYACTFIFLTTEESIPYLKEQPLFARLASLCSVEFVEISDLIFDSSQGIHNITIALAYERGMRSRGNQMCNTYFFYLVADYLFSNFSFYNLRRYFEKGYSGITHQAFRVTEETFTVALKEQEQCVFNAQDLLKIAFGHKHPVTIAETVTQHATHAFRANHLFWQVDDTTMISRCYTRHMLCIKPERDDYILSGLCDYCFIPIMCPSGNVAHIQDSDEVCIVEIAPADHDRHQIRIGPLNTKLLAHELSGILTLSQRMNIHFPIIYHSTPLKHIPKQALQASSEYVHAIQSLFSRSPAPLHDHHFWTRTIRLIFNNILKEKDKSRFYHKTYGTFAGIIGSSTFSTAGDDRPILTLARSRKSKQVKKNLFDIGRSLLSSWFGDQRLKKMLRRIVREHDSIFIAFEPQASIIQWLEENYPKKITYLYYDFLLLRTETQITNFFNMKKSAIVFLAKEHAEKLDSVMHICEKYLQKESISICYE